MRERNRRPFPKHERKQLNTAPCQSKHLTNSAFAIMASDLSVLESGLSGELTDLKRVTGRQYNGVPASLEFPDDRLEEGNMGSIIQVDPNLLRSRKVNVVGIFVWHGSLRY